MVGQGEKSPPQPLHPHTPPSAGSCRASGVLSFHLHPRALASPTRASLPLWKVHRALESPSRRGLVPHWRVLPLPEAPDLLPFPRGREQRTSPIPDRGKTCFLEPGEAKVSPAGDAGRGGGPEKGKQPSVLSPRTPGAGLRRRASPAPPARRPSRPAIADLPASPWSRPAAPALGRSRPAPLRAARLTFAPFTRRRAAPPPGPPARPPARRPPRVACGTHRACPGPRRAGSRPRQPRGRALRPAGVPARARSGGRRLGKVRGPRRGCNPSGRRRGGGGGGGEEGGRGGGERGPRRSFHTHGPTPLPGPPALPTAAANPWGSLCPGAHPFHIWEPGSKRLFRFRSSAWLLRQPSGAALSAVTWDEVSRLGAPRAGARAPGRLWRGGGIC